MARGHGRSRIDYAANAPGHEKAGQDDGGEDMSSSSCHEETSQIAKYTIQDRWW